MAVVVFNPEEFKQVMPQFADLSDDVLNYYFGMATGVIDNTDASPFPYDPIKGIFARKYILYALTCHLLTMRQRAANGQPGPLTSASEGSVSTGFAVPPVSDRSYYSETACGRSFLALIRPYALGGRIVPACHWHPWG
jgi:hypothetical protein